MCPALAATGGGEKCLSKVATRFHKKWTIFLNYFPRTLYRFFVFIKGNHSFSRNVAGRRGHICWWIIDFLNFGAPSKRGLTAGRLGLEGFKSSSLQVFKAWRLTGLKAASLQVFKSSRPEGFKSSSFQDFKAWRLAGFKFWSGWPAPFGFSGLPFWSLGASFLTFWELFLHSGASWAAILAPRYHLGGPSEQQDGSKVANDKIFVDFGMIWRFVYVSFLGSKLLEN